MLSINKQYIELVFYRAYAQLRVEASRNYLNFLWWILDPLLSMATFYIVFGILIQRGTPDFVPFLLIGLVSWQWFSNTFSHCMPSILYGTILINQVYIPKAVFPFTIILMDTIKFTFVLSLLLIFLWLYGFPPSKYYFALPFVIIIQGIFITGTSLLISAFVPFVQDLQFIFTALLQLLFFASGVFFSTDILPPEYLEVYHLNPITIIIESWRDILMYQQWPDFYGLAYVSVISIILLAISIFSIKHFDYQYPRVVFE